MMKNEKWDKEKNLRICLGGMFMIYVIFLLRITLFKQASLYNLFSAIGTGTRSVSLIPFGSIVEMIRTGVSSGRIVENVLGNILLFMPFGVIFPAVFAGKASGTKTKQADMRKYGRRKVIMAAFGVSFFIEMTQLLLALGSTDIDDLFFNVLGAWIGYFVYDRVRKTGIIIVMMAAFGLVVFGYLLIFQTDLFTLSRYETVVENGELVASFIDTRPDFAGKFVKLEGNFVEAEKSVSSAAKAREIAEFELGENSRIYVCYDEIKYFFSAIAGEKQEYEQISREEFILREKAFGQSNVRIWSRDGKVIDNIILIIWKE